MRVRNALAAFSRVLPFWLRIPFPPLLQYGESHSFTSVPSQMRNARSSIRFLGQRLHLCDSIDQKNTSSPEELRRRRGRLPISSGRVAAATAFTRISLRSTHAVLELTEPLQCGSRDGMRGTGAAPGFCGEDESILWETGTIGRHVQLAIS
jgi:hypothetical protein